MDYKPGILTTEFWMTIINAAIMFLVAFKVVGQEEGDQITALAAPLVAAVLPIIIYVWGRAKVKSA